MTAALWWLWELVSLLACGGLIARLGDDDFDTREAATAELRSVGWVAYPALCRALAHPDPEVAWRADRLHRPMWDFAENWRAFVVLAGPDHPDPLALFTDYDLRRRMYRLVCFPDSPVASFYHLHPDHDKGAFECWLAGQESHDSFAWSLKQTREELHPGWFVAPPPREK